MAPRDEMRTIEAIYDGSRRRAWILAVVDAGRLALSALEARRVFLTVKGQWVVADYWLESGALYGEEELGKTAREWLRFLEHTLLYGPTGAEVLGEESTLEILREHRLILRSREGILVYDGPSADAMIEAMWLAPASEAPRGG